MSLLKRLEQPTGLNNSLPQRLKTLLKNPEKYRELK